MKGKIRCFLFSTHPDAPVIVELESPCPGYPVEYMDVTRYFPHGSFSVRVAAIPGTNTHIGTHYRIYFDMHSAAAPVNRFFLDNYGIPWSGNVMVARYHRQSGGDAVVFGRMQRNEQAWCTAVVLG
jgi:hypothetical protein